MAILRKLWYWIFIVYLSSKWVFRVNLGNKVVYKGNVHTICNGVRPYSWRLDNLDNNDDGWVSRKDCKLVLSFSNLSHSFRSGYQFYMTSWFGIWINEGIKPWMRNCSIW